MSAGERIVRLWVEAQQTGVLNKSKLALGSALGRRIPPSWAARADESQAAGKHPSSSHHPRKQISVRDTGWNPR
jgi:hypothetical protein